MGLIWQYPEWVSERLSGRLRAGPGARRTAQIAACALLLCVASTYAQRGSPTSRQSPTLRQMYHTKWTQVDGAPADITTIAQSPDGFLFLGTTTGLYRFDGVKFEPFVLPAGARSRSRTITALEILTTGEMWIGYAFGGASRVVRGHVTDYSEDDGLPRGQVNAFATDSTGIVWAAASTGLAHLSGKRWIRASVDHALADANTTALLVDARGMLWAASFAGVYSLARDAQAFIRRGPSLGDTDHSALAAAADGSVWGASTTGGLSPLAAADGAVASTRGGRRGPARTTALFFDRDGNAWISALNHLAWLASNQMQSRGPDGQRRGDDASVAPASFKQSMTASIEQSMSRQDGLSGDRVMSIVQDREGSVWIGTEGGLDRFRATKLTAIDLPDLLGPALTAGKNGELWVASLMRSPLVLRGNAVQHTDGPSDIECAFGDPDGSVWLGGERGLWQVANGVTVRVAKPSGFEAAYVQAISRQRDETLWLSLVRAGVFRRRGNGAWSLFAAAPEGGRLPAVRVVSDDVGGTWLGYTQDRLARVSADDSVRLFTTADGLHVGTVTAVHVRGANVWVGGEFGLMVLDGEKLKSISTTDPEALRGISGVVETGDGELWVNGAGGIVRLPAADLRRARADSAYRIHAERLDYHDGVKGVAAQIRPLPSAIEAADGRLWFATSTGVLTIDPRHVRRNQLPPAVQIRDVEAGGTSYTPNDSIILPARTTSLQIRYTALSLAIPERVRFRYQLVGSDAEWQDAGTRREAFYTNLGPGAHRFRVIAANEDGIWNDVGASVSLYIPPTFVQTKTFLALCAVAFAVLAGLLVQWRQRRVTAAIRSRFEVTLTERTRIAQELHDTLLQGFTGVTAQLYAVRALLRTRPADAESTLGDALVHADASLREAREAVWELRSPLLGTLTLPEALEAVRDDIASSGADVRIAIGGAARPLRRATELTALRVGRECIVNAMRHANATTVIVELVYETDRLTLVVADDGRGFAADVESAAHRAGHWGLVGMRERAAKAGGTLVVDSALGKGTRVTLVLPIDDAG